jgi:glycosyltransferase involved in cell wall biosynthesis
MLPKKQNLGVFFDTGMSFGKWEKYGILDREIEPYILLSKYFRKIFFFSYGDLTENKYKKKLPGNCEIICKNKLLPDFFYNIMIPFIHSKRLKEIDIIKTNQMKGSIPCVISKFFFNNKLIIRTGYTWSLANEIENKANFNLIKYIINSIRIPFTERLAYKNADQVLVSARYDKEYISKKFNIPKSRITIIGNYINTDFFKPKKSNKEKNKIIYVGRIEKSKNLFELAKAAKSSKVNLVIIGEGKCKSELVEYSKKIGAKIEFLGIVPNIKLPYILNRFEIFVLPSLWEGMPKSLLEAMSSGLSCIGTNVKGTKEIIADKKNGILCNTDYRSFSEAINLLKNNPGLRDKLGKNARNTVIEKFDLKKNINIELGVYKRIIKYG